MWSCYLAVQALQDNDNDNARVVGGGVYDRQRAPRGAPCLLSFCQIFILNVGKPVPQLLNKNVLHSNPQDGQHDEPGSYEVRAVGPRAEQLNLGYGE